MKPSWKTILSLLGMDTAKFQDADEQEEAHRFMSDYIDEYGPEWLKNNANYAMNQWETYKFERRKDIERKRRQKKKKKGLLAKLLKPGAY